MTQMTQEDILKKVIDITRKQLGVNPEREILDTDKFIEGLSADSLDQVELIMAFEEEYSIKITDEEAAKVKTVNDAVNLILEKKGN